MVLIQTGAYSINSVIYCIPSESVSSVFDYYYNYCASNLFVQKFNCNCQGIVWHHCNFLDAYILRMTGHRGLAGVDKLQIQLFR